MKRKLLLPIVLGALLAGGCSSFNRQWNSARKQPLPTDISGPWEGRWISDSNGHNDKLRCIITATSTNTYDANFHANYKRLFHFGYTVPLQVQREGDRFTFSGEADLGKLAGGLYTYQGSATPTNYLSSYNSKYDHGKFELHRPAE